MDMTLPIELNLDACQFTDEQFFQLCQNNRDLRLERSATNELIIRPPTDGETGNRNAALTYQLYAWNLEHKQGIAFGSSTGFQLANGAVRSPSLAWITIQQWKSLSSEEREKFAPFSPVFLVELLAANADLYITQNKMTEYINNGTQLGWLINRKTKQVEIYRPNQTVEILDTPLILSGEDILVGFELDLSTIW